MVEKLGYYFLSLRHLGVDVPFVVMISLLGVKGYSIGPQETARIYGIGCFDRDMILIPEVVFESFDADVPQLMKQAFDTVWNAAGWAGSIKG